MKPQARRRCVSTTGWDRTATRPHRIIQRCGAAATHKVVVKHLAGNLFRCTPTYMCARHASDVRLIWQRDPSWAAMAMRPTVYRFRRP